MKRTFIALPVYPDQELVNTIDLVRQINLGAKIKWISHSQWHFTLAFLGNTDAKSESKVKSILNNLADNADGISIRLSGFGVFSNLLHPKIIWIGIERNYALEYFTEKLHLVLKNSGIEFDSKFFTPHLTIGRVRHVFDSRLFVQGFKSLGEPVLGDYHFRELGYYESVLNETSGHQYLALKKWSLE